MTQAAVGLLSVAEHFPDGHSEGPDGALNAVLLVHDSLGCHPADGRSCSAGATAVVVSRVTVQCVIKQRYLVDTFTTRIILDP